MARYLRLEEKVVRGAGGEGESGDEEEQEEEELEGDEV